ncbi:MAG: DUF1858 domain-containing protein [Bacteroidales bacterium]|nr:DUF1858 domain-containing protein [Bacteroidales bacterium]MDT8432842.1 DUF1858 domain-containing protein [Bacteroidales bacterium]
MEPLIITPKTKIYDLLEAYPQLEDPLITAAPQFKKLKNPILRKTIARVTTLSQAATIGGIRVEELVNALREAAGQEHTAIPSEEESSYNYEQPEWFAAETIAATIDIREMLNAGEQPVHEVLSTIKKLEAGQVLELIAPFLPAPLVDKASGLGYAHWIMDNGTEEFRIYFKNK